MSEAAPGLGQRLREAREATGLSQQGLARELAFPVHLVAAIEAEDWALIPPGRERPLVRRMAERLALDLEELPELWNQVPGGPEVQEPPDPRQDRLERLFTGLLTLGSALLVLWLVVPGKDLRNRSALTSLRTESREAAPWQAPTNQGPYPVLGEVLPEAPLTEEGILVSLRTQDTCEAILKTEKGDLRQALRISEPWRLRVKGAFTLTLNNAGVVVVEVAGRRIRHGRNVGEAWMGRFDAQGLWLPADGPTEVPLPTAPETDDPTEKEP